MKFSIITVALNPGEKLEATLDSVLGQSCKDAEVVLQDGGSRDGALERWLETHEQTPERERVQIISEKDAGIYDAMNRAVERAGGEFLLFLNCGDIFWDDRVLERTLDVLAEEERAGTDMNRLVLYGDT